MRITCILTLLTAIFASSNLFGQTNTFPFPSSGNVGIGTTSPQFPLHINSGSAATGRFQNIHGYIDLGPLNNSAAHIYTDRPHFAFNKDLLLVGNPSRITAYQSNPFRISTGGEDRFTILQTGDIGIGTTAPSNTQGWNKAVEIVGNANSKLLVSSQTNTVKMGIFAHSFWGDGAKGVIGTESNHDLAIHTGYTTERIRVKTNGNVGIGISNPSQKLEVNGTIRAKEIKLEAANWPDYVFIEGYHLMSLEDVMEHIDQNGHLPGLKSAKEYEAEGVSIMELNQKLLEKIEELTLYTIEQDAKNKSQDIQIKEMQLEIKKLYQLTNSLR